MYKFIICLLLLFNTTNIIYAQYPNIKINTTNDKYGPEEVIIAINPANPLNIVAGANLNYYFFSFDGGLTWNEGHFAPEYFPWGDPCLIFNSKGDLIFTHLTNSPFGKFIDRLGIEKSSDGGMTWAYTSSIGLERSKQQDKEWLAVDYSNSIYRDYIYMAWTEFDEYASKSPSDSSRILFSRSTDSGVNWDSPQRISETGGNCLDDDYTVEGAMPVVDNDGNVYVVWSDYEKLKLDISTDGGKTFGYDKIVADQPGSWVFDIPGLQRCSGMPSIASDISQSKFRGNLYILWSDQRNGIDNTDVYFIKSSDKAKNWSDVKKINADSLTGHQFFPSMTVDPITGFIYIVYYNMSDTATKSTDVYCARSTDGGETFNNFIISNTPFIANPNVFLGDYIGIAAYNGRAYPIWTRIDNFQLSVWGSIIDDTNLLSIPDNVTINNDFYLSANYPNPFDNFTRIDYNLPSASHVKLILYNSTLMKAQSLINEYQTAGTHSFIVEKNNLVPGVYFYELQAAENHSIKSFVVLY